MQCNKIFRHITVFGVLSLVGCGGAVSSDTTQEAALSHNSGNTTTTVANPLLDPPADLVLGQADFVSQLANRGMPVSDSGFNSPMSVAIDQSVIPNRIYVSDFNNNRVLGWADVSALTNGSPADLVIGQSDFSGHVCNFGGISSNSLCAPMEIAVDTAGNLYVTDRGNSRILIYFTPFTTDTKADFVLGQPTFKSAGCSNSSRFVASTISLCDPFGVAVDGAGDVYVADMANNRVLEYDTPLATDALADHVFGQPDFASTGFGIGTTGLNQPYDVAVDHSGNLYVVDFQNHRVLEYDNPLGNCLTCDTVADRVIGQPNFSSGLPNAGGGVTKPSAGSLSYPVGVAVDSMDNLYVSERGNSRVLEFDTPLTTDAVADQVFGQSDFIFNGCNKRGLSAKSLCLPYSAAVDGENNLWVVDFANNRVLRYDDPVVLPSPENVTIPNSSFHFEEGAAKNCSLQNEVEFSFEKTPGDPTSGDGGYTTNDIVSSSVTAIMTFSDGTTAQGVSEGAEDEQSKEKAIAGYGGVHSNHYPPPDMYAHEFEVLFDCSTMTEHTFPGEVVKITVSGTLNDGNTFSGSGAMTPHS